MPAHFKKAYHSLVNRLTTTEQTREAMSLAVGGNYDTVGILERELLVQHGLGENDYLIDVGCGSGRLTRPLSEYLSGRYLGLDIEQSLVDYAKDSVNRPDWQFKITEGVHIPEQDSQADIICFFSIFTHLLYEETYRYLQESMRVLKPGGKIIFSFLEFEILDQWVVFEANMVHASEGDPLMMFMDRFAIRAFAKNIGLEVLHIIDGNKAHIPISEPLTFDNGQTITDKGRLGPIGQSVCVLQKPIG
jgi:ubiquinone/menaquinone biosynthesis C-methylase UbiE